MEEEPSSRSTPSTSATSSARASRAPRSPAPSWTPFPSISRGTTTWPSRARRPGVTGLRALDPHPMDDLAAMIGSEVDAVLAPRQEITTLIARAYATRRTAWTRRSTPSPRTETSAPSQRIDDSEDVLDVSNKAPIIKLVNTILFQALKLRSSDVHFQPYLTGCRCASGSTASSMTWTRSPSACRTDHQPRQGHGQDGHRGAPAAPGRPRIATHR